VSLATALVLETSPAPDPQRPARFTPKFKLRPREVVGRASMADEDIRRHLSTLTLLVWEAYLLCTDHEGLTHAKLETIRAKVATITWRPPFEAKTYSLRSIKRATALLTELGILRPMKKRNVTLRDERGRAFTRTQPRARFVRGYTPELENGWRWEMPRETKEAILRREDGRGKWPRKSRKGAPAATQEGAAGAELAGAAGPRNVPFGGKKCPRVSGIRISPEDLPIPLKRDLEDPARREGARVHSDFSKSETKSAGGGGQLGLFAPSPPSSQTPPGGVAPSGSKKGPRARRDGRPTQEAPEAPGGEKGGAGGPVEAQEAPARPSGWLTGWLKGTSGPVMGSVRPPPKPLPLRLIPHLDHTICPPATTPMPRKLPEDTSSRTRSELELVSRLVWAYRATVKGLWGRKTTAYRVPLKHGDREFAQLLEVAKLLREEEIAPIAWATWVMDGYLARMPKTERGAKPKPPFLTSVFCVSKVRENAELFGRELGDRMGGQIIPTPIRDELVRKHRAMMNALYGLPDRSDEAAVLAVVEQYFPDDSFERWVSSANLEVRQVMLETKRKAQLGEYVW